MDFSKCNSPKEIMDLLFSDPAMAYFSNKGAAERFNQIGCTDEAIKFYLLAQNTEMLESFNLSIENSESFVTAGRFMVEASENNNTAAQLMNCASENMREASQRMVCN